MIQSQLSQFPDAVREEITRIAEDFTQWQEEDSKVDLGPRYLTVKWTPNEDGVVVVEATMEITFEARQQMTAYLARMLRYQALMSWVGGGSQQAALEGGTPSREPPAHDMKADTEPLPPRTVDAD